MSLKIKKQVSQIPTKTKKPKNKQNPVPLGDVFCLSSKYNIFPLQVKLYQTMLSVISTELGG